MCVSHLILAIGCQKMASTSSLWAAIFSLAIPDAGGGPASHGTYGPDALGNRLTHRPPTRGDPAPPTEETKMTDTTTAYQALVLALRLAITASTQARADDCVSIAEGLAANLSDKQVLAAKAEAIEATQNEK